MAIELHILRSKQELIIVSCCFEDGSENETGIEALFLQENDS